MRKGLFFSLPSVSVHHTLTPFLDEISSAYEIVCYNTEAFRPAPDGRFRFKAYPPYEGGYNPGSMEVTASHFKFGEVLFDTAHDLLDFLVAEVESEKPDFILHSHLALWGKLLARHFRLPAVTLFTTFILDERIMLPGVRALNSGQKVDFANIHQGKVLYQKIQSLYQRLQLADKIDIWDLYVNKGGLNLSFILEAFQPRKEILGPEHQFVGFPLRVPPESVGHEIIYVALGTVFNQEEAFYRLCIRVLEGFAMPCVLSVGRKINKEIFGALPGHITIEQFTDQVRVLGRTAVFLTRGGMASVHEAVHTLTPMVVIPDIPEQKLTAAKIEELGIGVHLAGDALTEETLATAIRRVLENHPCYVDNLKSLLATGQGSSPARAHQLLDDQLNKWLQPHGC